MHDIDIDEDNWKQAASQESVDYQAVESTFMTQAYGFVANKAKVLFRDPFRLGFEIVHRNEKATKMVGIFAFRCNNSLLYAPVFFVNGEIKGADMLYRSEVKRFVPLTDKWCSFLVRGANEESGTAQRKGHQRRQQAGNLDRLAYPQRTKYAGHLVSVPDLSAPTVATRGEATDEELTKAANSFPEMFAHCAQDDAAPAMLLPRALQAGGPDFLVKLAGMIESSDLASRFLAENYTAADLTVDPDWCVKQASKAAAALDPLAAYRGSVVLVREPGLAKSATHRKGIMEHGYVLEDYRELGAINSTIEYVDDPTLYELASAGNAAVMDTDGESFAALVAHCDDDWLSGDPAGRGSPRPGGSGDRVVIALSDGDYKHVYSSMPLIGNLDEDTSALDRLGIKPSAAKVGKAYVLFHKGQLRVSQPFVITGKEGKTIQITTLYGSKMPNLIYKADVENADPARGLLNSDYVLLPLRTEKDADLDYHATVWTKSLMSPSQLDTWLRTGGGLTHSKDITITKEPSGLFTLSAKGSDGFHKVARGLDRMDAHLSLAGDYEMCVSAAGEVLSFAEDKDTTRFRLYDTVSKSGYVTRMRPEAEWQTGYDPILNTRIETPQQQQIGTDTPERAQQDHRIGDRYMGEAPPAYNDPEEDGLPYDAVMSMAPEELAMMSQKYNMPHAFDHEVVGNLASNTYDTIEQVRQYIPDLETGVDRYARTLFLLRYRPADFEEAYGKDELMEMEQELSSLFLMAGESLLRMLKRFDTDKFSVQSDS